MMGESENLSGRYRSCHLEQEVCRLQHDRFSSCMPTARDEVSGRPAARVHRATAAEFAVRIVYPVALKIKVGLIPRIRIGARTLNDLI
jgi:hypothetical protein